MKIPIKTEREAEKMRQSCRAASDVLDRVTGLIRPGITTGEVDQAAADFMAELGCKSASSAIAVSPVFCISERSSRARHRWTSASVNDIVKPMSA
jgi:methionine aminopeptidase